MSGEQPLGFSLGAFGHIFAAFSLPGFPGMPFRQACKQHLSGSQITAGVPLTQEITSTIHRGRDDFNGQGVFIGGESTPAVGVAHGLDRIMLAEKTQKLNMLTKIETNRVHKKKVLLFSEYDETKGKALRISERLRNAQIMTEFEIMGRTFDKSQKKAKQRKIDYMVVIDPHHEEGCVLLIDLDKNPYDTSSRRIINLDLLIEELRPRKKIKGKNILAS